MISLPIFAQCSLASTKASRSASEAPTVVAEVMYVSGPNSKTLGWEHATKRVRTMTKLNMTFMIASPFMTDVFANWRVTTDFKAS